jgi:GAF domain-containing protein
MGGGVDAVARRLRALSDAVLSPDAVEDVVDAFLAAARELLAVDQVHLIEVSQDAAVGHARVVAYEAGGLREDAYVMVLDERPSGTTHVVSTGEALHVPDAPSSTALRQDYTQRFGVRSALFVPLCWDDDVRWVTVLIRTTEAPFTGDQIELAQVMANLAAAGLALLEARDRQNSRHDAGDALARAAAALHASTDPTEVLRLLSSEANTAVEGDMAGFYLGDQQTGGVATAGHNTPPGWIGYRIRPGEGVGGQVLQSGLPAISSAYQTDVELPENPGLRDLRTAVAVPVRWDGEVRGALSIGFRSLRRVSPQALRTLEAIADLAGVACREAQRRTATDG